MLKPYIDPRKRRRKMWIIVISLIFGIALGACGYVVYKQYFTKEPILDNILNLPTPDDTIAICNLDGTKVAKDKASRHPLAIIVENHTQARPQSGLDKASIIYEAISEGGITRYMAIYGPKDAEKVGPVRSMRTYFLDFADEYNAFLAHVGGNIDALDRISQEKALDLDEFSLGETAYWREKDYSKAIEHTMFTSTSKLYSAAQTKGWDMRSSYTPLNFFKNDEFTINPNNKQQITIDFSSPQYKVSYTYDSLNNNYPRTLAGSPHKDAVTGNQLAPTNIIIQSVERWESPTRINEPGWAMQTTGSGKAYILYGGQKIDASWKKDHFNSRTIFYDSSGQEIKFLPGQFWYEIVPPDVFDKISISTE